MCPRLALLPPLLLGLLVLPLPAAGGDAAAGRRVFNQCRACHTIEAGGRHGVGPNLHGIIDRKAGSVEGYRYSAALRRKGEEGLVWTEDQLRAYLADPKGTIPGGSMTYVGLRNEAMLGDLLAFLREAAGPAR